MSGQENGLTLGGLAEKLGTLTERLGGLERENERMRSENAGLRQKVAALTGSGKGEVVVVEAAPGFEGPVSRRALFGKAGAAAVAAVAAGTLLNTRQAKADHGGPGIFVDFVVAHTDGGGSAIFGDAPNATGVEGNGRTGVVGDGKIGVHGITGTTGNGAVYGQHTGTSGFGVVGDGKSTAGAGVFGRNSVGHGVRGDGSIGVVGNSSTANSFGVYGRHFGANGYGVRGDGKGSGAGVLGRNSSVNSVGVQGEGTAIGVKGVGSTGYGGHFSGATAQVKLLPHSNTGRPTTGTHQMGELFLDSAAALFVCTASGTPGTWRRVTTTAA